MTNQELVRIINSAAMKIGFGVSPHIISNALLENSPPIEGVLLDNILLQAGRATIALYWKDTKTGRWYLVEAFMLKEKPESYLKSIFTNIVKDRLGISFVEADQVVSISEEIY